LSWIVVFWPFWDGCVVLSFFMVFSEGIFFAICLIIKLESIDFGSDLDILLLDLFDMLFVLFISFYLILDKTLSFLVSK
jgi:hypothetical protein